MNKTNVMVDLETWSTSPNAVITSLGAVKFNLNPDNSGGTIIDEFYYRIDPQSCIDVGLEMSVDTILWWMKQPNDARAEFQKPTWNVKDVLALFSSWLADDSINIDLWGNGSDFDNVLLANAYRICGRELPWRYFNNRCYRTLKNLYPTVPSMVNLGVKHNALDDAKSQANHLINILCHINKLTVPTVISEVPKVKKFKKEAVRIALPKPSSDKILKVEDEDSLETISLIGEYNDVKKGVDKSKK